MDWNFAAADAYIVIVLNNNLGRGNLCSHRYISSAVCTRGFARFYTDSVDAVDRAQLEQAIDD